VTGFFPTPYGKSKERAETHYLQTGNRGRGRLFIRDYFEPLGYNVKSSKNKHIPLAIRSASKDILHEFLEAYFECDSGINGGGGSYDSPAEIEVDSPNKKYYDPRVWLRKAQETMIARLEQAFKELNAIDVL
jgi:hypothetical protein